MTTSSSNNDLSVETSFAAPPTAETNRTPLPPEVSKNLFQQCLLNELRDGVIFVDACGKVSLWSQTVEVMTGLPRRKVEGMAFSAELIGLLGDDGQVVDEDKNPLAECLQTRKKVTGNYKLVGRSGREAKVEMSLSPVVDLMGEVHGAVILVHDSSVQLDLQRQLRDLFEFSTLDPLTQVANRVEFERVLYEFVQARDVSDFSCSLIVCDIDFFKAINDNYNHHIGDQALIAFAALLKKFVRSQDLVARYGGEEFVILCPNCDMESAIERAEEIRLGLTQTPMGMIGGKCITASFGVTEIVKGDSTTDFFVRADTALLRAKELGRNRVVESMPAKLGGAPKLRTANITSLSGVDWRKINGETLVSEEYCTTNSLSVLVEKLRGYIVEVDAEIIHVETNYASLVVAAEDSDNFGRKGKFIVDIDFQEQEVDEESKSFRRKTFIRITVREAKRSWFAANAVELAPQVVSEMRRYLMINDDASKFKAAATVGPGKPRA